MTRKRGRKSAASLSVVTPLTAVPRPDPPDDDALLDEEFREWQAIVDRLPSDHFPRETHAMLAAYCRHVVAGRKIAAAIRTLETALTGEIAKGRPAVEIVCESASTLDRLLKMRDREVRAASSLATRLRITQQASKPKEKLLDLPAPWESAAPPPRRPRAPRASQA